MFFVVVGAVLVAPIVFNTFNRVLEEIIIPKQELTKLRKRRTQQAADGVLEEERETTHHVPLDEIAKDIEITDEEFRQLRDMGALDIIARGANRRPHIKRAEEAQRASA
jgi:hypothetical protein